MSVPSVVLVDSDEQYASLLEYKFLEELGGDVRFETITDSAYAVEFFSTPHSIDALIVSENAYNAAMEKQNVGSLFILTETQGVEGEKAARADCIFKYSSVNYIFDRIVASSAGLRAASGDCKDTQVVLFYSPVGGSGKTTLAVAMASYLRSVYKRALYVDAEYMQSFSALMDSAVNAPNEMLDSMMTLSRNPYDGLSHFIMSDCCDYLPPLRAALVSTGLDFGFFQRFIEAAKESGAYDYIIVDTDSVFNEEKIPLLANADKVVLAVTQSNLSCEKTRRLLDNLDSAEIDKYHFICNMYRSDETNAFSGEGVGSSIGIDTFIDYDPAVKDMNGSALAEHPSFSKCAYSLM